jgi:hypothetical protein
MRNGKGPGKMTARADLTNARYLNEIEAATYTTLARRTLQKYRASGDGPVFLKRGGRIIYPVDLLDKWMADGRDDARGRG